MIQHLDLHLKVHHVCVVFECLNYVAYEVLLILNRSFLLLFGEPSSQSLCFLIVIFLFWVEVFHSQHFQTLHNRNQWDLLLSFIFSVWKPAVYFCWLGLSMFRSIFAVWEFLLPLPLISSILQRWDSSNLLQLVIKHLVFSFALFLQEYLQQMILIPFYQFFCTY